ncbi:MAG: hypothetical protein LBS20_01410 [Prevotella sp.]|nr:hypothetical protein [Prevotella sp.]
MRHLLLTLCLPVFFNISIMGQEKIVENIPKDILDCLVEMGTDTLSTLNICESKFLNFCFQKEKDTFDFYGKKMAFFKGNTGTIKSTKKEYFDVEKQLIYSGRFPSPRGQLIIFNEDEAKKVGYDVVFIVYNKKYITKEDIIKRLKEKH